MKSTLTPKQEKFCHAYLETGNASEAYRLSYNTDRMKPETIKRKAKFLLDHEKVGATIGQLRDELKETSDIKKKRLLYELEAIMESKITDYVELKTERVPIIAEGQLLGYKNESILKFKDFEDLTPLQVRAIESVKQSKYGLELKLHGKSWAIERISKLLGYDAATKNELSFNFDQMSDSQLDSMIDKISNHE